MCVREGEEGRGGWFIRPPVCQSVLLHIDRHCVMGCVAYKPSDADELSEVTCLHYHASEVWTVSVSTVYGATLPSADHVT